MAIDTPLAYRNLVIYQVFVRNHSPQGTFCEVERDLERIRSMGVDILYLMPIHPIGKVARKGSLGSPYSISDYSAINPEYGTVADFQRLLDAAHKLGLKIIIDVVYNHTAHDSKLVKEHPDWFHQDSRGCPVTTVPAWSDVIDLKHPNQAMSQFLITILQNWVRMGIDGFRCDVASLVPLEFWMEAREKVSHLKPGVIWLAESVHASFVGDRRSHGLFALSDSEIFSAFDIAYDYDIWPVFQAAVMRKIPVSQYIDMVRFQDCIYPGNYVKMRCVENHDQMRIQKLASSENAAMAWTALIAFNKGPFFIYAGQETGAVHTPSLFERDTILWDTYRLQKPLTALAGMKKHPVMLKGQFSFVADQPSVQAIWHTEETCLYGIFNVSGSKGKVQVKVEDGIYSDLLHTKTIEIKNGQVQQPDDAIIFECALNERPIEMPSALFGID